MTPPSFLEDHLSQIPALQLLQNLGYTYLRPQEVHLERGGKLSNVVLEGILEKQLRRLNRIRFKGREHEFSSANIQGAVQALKDLPHDKGLVLQSEHVYDLLSLGKSFEQTIGGDTKSFSIRYIDWDEPANNVFHVAAEFEVARSGAIQSAGSKKNTRRPDIVLFVNGIPFAVVECKRPDLKDPLAESISQNLRNQRKDEIPDLFAYTQLVMGVTKNEASYATIGTPKQFWAKWRERDDIEDTVARLINRPLSTAQKDQLFGDQFSYTRNYFEDLEAEGDRSVTEQDRSLYSLCRPERLIDLAHGFIVFDAGVKKIARYQQYFAVKKTVARVKNRDEQAGRRRGGVIWHTQGSGKSLTMVMMAKALAQDPDIENPKVVLVTDRVDLDDQIWRTFHHCGKDPVQAKTGRHLLDLLVANKEAVITTVIDKFQAAVKKENYCDENENIFVLVDEGHRGQYGTANVNMQRVLPNACYLGFTGTPLMKKEKNTAARFGGIIDTYTIDEAVRDHAVVPLLYEGRHALLDVNKAPIDKWFSVVAEPLSDEQQADLKRKFSSADQLNKVRGKIYQNAYDISEHWAKNWQGTPFKAQLTAPSKYAALQYKACLDEFGKVSSEVLISGPDTREGNEDIYTTGKDEVEAFWKVTMERFGTEKAYNREIINQFLGDGAPEIIIVVDKLLTGFDAPRNTVLYVCRSLKEHFLLQAIARVNRLYPGKDFGHIVDYYGVIEKLGEAIDLYSSLDGFDAADLAGTVTDVSAEVAKLPQRHSELWDIFKGVANKKDEEAYELLLGDEELRVKFYDKLSAFNRTLGIALSTLEFITETPPEKVDRYKSDLVFFLKLRASVKQRYAETIDYSEYEAKVQKLLDQHVTSHEVIRITDPVNIFETERFQEELDKKQTPASKADTIAHRTKKTIHERMDEDPAFYRRFSKILEEAIQAFREKRISDAEYLKRATDAMTAIRNRTDDSIPAPLEGHEVAKAFFGAVNESLEQGDAPENARKTIAVEAALQIDKAIQSLKVVNWVNNVDVENEMRNAIDDILFDVAREKGLALEFDQLDRIADQCLTIARARYAS
ncbi:MAG: type I restriction endonuclease subunit R [Verrucomicrobiae bacterium]|nr:type I restriction endonuclease subunit R [Verrucomicrobiae bacterium]